MVLLLVATCKLYTHLMVNILHKLPADPGSDPLFKVYSFDPTISQETVSYFTDWFVSILNSVVSKMRSLFLFENVFDSIKFAIGLYFGTCIGSISNLLTIITLAWILLFTFPKLYQNNKVVVDNTFEKVKVRVEELKNKIPSPMKTYRGVVSPKAKSPDKEE